MTLPSLLLLNTCGAQAIVALADASRVLAEEVLPARNTSEALMPAIRRVLGAMPVAQLQAIAVVNGPGSFTGVRVGLAAAKGLAEAAACPLILLSRLQLLADAQPGATPLLDGGRNEFFIRQNDVEQLAPQAHIAAAALITCEPRVLAAFPHATLIAEPAAAALLAATLPRLAAQAFTDTALADANYIRRTDAELKRTQP